MEIGLDDSGQGEPVVLLHSSCFSRRQWGPLVRAIDGRYRTLAIDLYGYGLTEFPRRPETFDIQEEVGLVNYALARVEGPAHFVGHSYGGAVALLAALQQPERVRSITVHEPVAFQLARSGGLEDVDLEVSQMVATLVERIAAGEPEEAARYFIDYWRGEGTWAALPEKGQRGATRVIKKLPLEFEAVLRTPYKLDDYAALSMPVYLTTGTTGRSAARRIASLLATVLGEQTLHPLSGVGHMAPVTHPDLVNAHILAHLAANPIA
jgi:pimeloyl-ACP methyl ester carboxylesterase